MLIGSLSWHGKFSVLLMFCSCPLCILTKIMIRTAALDQIAFAAMMELRYQTSIGSWGRCMMVEAKLFTWPQLVRLCKRGLLLVLFHLFRITDTFHSIVMLLIDAQMHWPAIHVKLCFLLAMNCFRSISAKLSKRMGSFIQSQAYKRLLRRTCSFLQQSWKSQSILRVSKREFQNSTKCATYTNSVIP